MPAAPSTTSRVPFDLSLLSIVSVSACNMLGFSAVFALLPKLQDAHDLPTSGLGVITAASVVCSVFAQLVFARFADRGHALLVMRIGIACMCVGFGWFSLATELWQFALARALVGFGGGMFAPAARRSVVSRDPARAGEWLGIMVAVEVGGFALGPPLAIALYQVGGLRLPFMAPVVLLVFAGLVVRVGKTAIAHTTTPKGAVRSLLRLPTVRAALLVGAAANLSIGAFEPVIAKQLSDIGASDSATGLTLAGFALPYVFFSRYGGRLADRYGPFRTGVWSMLATVPMIAMFGLAESALMIAIVGIIRSVFDTITTPSGSTAMAYAAGPELLGTGQGLYGATGSLMTGVAALIGASVYGEWGAKSLWFSSAAAMLVLTLLMLVLSRRAGVWRPLHADFGASAGSATAAAAAAAADEVSAGPSPA